MPISQDKLMVFVRGAKTILELHESLRQIMVGTDSDISALNAVLESEPNHPATKAAAGLLERLNQISQTVRDFQAKIPTRLIVDIEIEERHYEKTAELNRLAALKQKQVREETGRKARKQHERTTSIAEVRDLDPVIPVKADNLGLAKVRKDLALLAQEPVPVSAEVKSKLAESDFVPKDTSPIAHGFNYDGTNPFDKILKHDEKEASKVKTGSRMIWSEELGRMVETSLPSDEKLNAPIKSEDLI